MTEHNAITIETLMAQVQVYASAWSLVGTPLAMENQLQLANDEKAAMEEMLEDFQEQVDTNAAPRNLQQIAEGLIDWHEARIRRFRTILETPADTEIRLGSGEAPMVLEGERLKGFRVGMALAQEWIEKFPLSISRTAPSDEEE